MVLVSGRREPSLSDGLTVLLDWLADWFDRPGFYIFECDVP